MLHFTDTMYAQIHEELLAAVGNKDFYNGIVDSFVEDAAGTPYTYTLSASLIIYRDKWDGEIQKIVPIWWSFDVEGGQTTNDFSIHQILNYYGKREDN